MSAVHLWSQSPRAPSLKPTRRAASSRCDISARSRPSSKRDARRRQAGALRLLRLAVRRCRVRLPRRSICGRACGRIRDCPAKRRGSVHRVAPFRWSGLCSANARSSRRCRVSRAGAGVVVVRAARRRYRLRLLVCVACCALLPLASARASAPSRWHAPAWWLAQAVCIHEHEGAWNDNTGNTYFGGLQFLASTWERAGGAHFAAFDHPGDARFPFTASIREQLHRAWITYRRDGDSWREWGTRAACRLR